MPIRNTTAEFGAVHKTLHWLVAVGIFALIWLGLQQSGMERSPERQEIRDLHGSIAIVVFLLMSVRLAWRFMNGVPAHPADTPAWQRAAAGIVHWGLYLAVFTQIVAGAMAVSTGGRPLDFFGTASIALPVAESDAAHEFWEEIHEVVWIAVVVLLAVHVGAALYNHFIARNDVLRRMTVGSRAD